VADDYTISDAELYELLEAPNSPAVQDLRESAQRVGRGARRRTHGRIAAGIEVHEPAQDGAGWHADIETAAEDPETGAPIGLFVEVGTKPHVIEAKGDYSLHNSGTGQYFGKKVSHPGTDPQPHLRPALYEDL
jgi:hypothetical protein